MTRTIILMLAALIFISPVDFINASDVTPRGGFMIGRIAAKRIKKMREQENSGAADQNKDGKLDKQKTDSAKNTSDTVIDDATFKKIDKNGDGLLSREGIEKAAKAVNTAKTTKDVKSGDKSKE